MDIHSIGAADSQAPVTGTFLTLDVILLNKATCENVIGSTSSSDRLCTHNTKVHKYCNSFIDLLAGCDVVAFGITLYTWVQHTCCEELCWYIRLTYLNILVEWMHLETIREVGASMTKFVYPIELLVRFLCRYVHKTLDTIYTH